MAVSSTSNNSCFTFSSAISCFQNPLISLGIKKDRKFPKLDDIMMERFIKFLNPRDLHNFGFLAPSFEARIRMPKLKKIQHLVVRNDDANISHAEDLIDVTNILSINNSPIFLQNISAEMVKVSVCHLSLTNVNLPAEKLLNLLSPKLKTLKLKNVKTLAKKILGLDEIIKKAPKLTFLKIMHTNISLTDNWTAVLMKPKLKVLKLTMRLDQVEPLKLKALAIENFYTNDKKYLKITIQITNFPSTLNEYEKRSILNERMFPVFKPKRYSGILQIITGIRESGSKDFEQYDFR